MIRTFFLRARAAYRAFFAPNADTATAGLASIEASLAAAAARSNAVGAAEVDLRVASIDREVAVARAEHARRQASFDREAIAVENARRAERVRARVAELLA